MCWWWELLVYCELVCLGENLFDRILVPFKYVAPGNLLHLSMLQEGTWQWFIEAQDETSGAYSWLLTGDFSPAMFYAYVTLEVANFGSCSEMPASGGESSFFDLSMTPAKDAVWASDNPNNECSADHDDPHGSTVVCAPYLGPWRPRRNEA